MKKLLIIMLLCFSISANAMYRSHLDKKEFLALDPLSYTINLSTIYNYDGYTDFVDELNTDKNIFVFEYGDNKDALMSKVLYGVFASYNDALAAINKLPKRLKENKPTVNTIGKFQELYKYYHINTDSLADFVVIRDMKKAKAKAKHKDIDGDIKTISFNQALTYV